MDRGCFTWTGFRWSENPGHRHRFTMKNSVEKIASFYLQGFRSMRLGRTLWAIILLKLFILFGVVKLFFFPDYLDTRFTTEDQKADYVLTELTQPKNIKRTP